MNETESSTSARCTVRLPTANLISRRRQPEYLYLTMKPSSRRHLLWASISAAQLSWPFSNTHKSRAFFVSGQLQHIFFPLFPNCGCLGFSEDCVGEIASAAGASTCFSDVFPILWSPGEVLSVSRLAYTPRTSYVGRSDGGRQERGGWYGLVREHILFSVVSQTRTNFSSRFSASVKLNWRKNLLNGVFNLQIVNF